MENFIFVQWSVKILDLAFFQKYNLGVTKIIWTMDYNSMFKHIFFLKATILVGTIEDKIS